MEIFSALLAICAGNSPVIGEFPAQRPVTRSFDDFFDLRLNEGWVNNPEADELRRHRAHYEVTVMMKVMAGQTLHQAHGLTQPVRSHFMVDDPLYVDRIGQTSRNDWNTALCRMGSRIMFFLWTSGKYLYESTFRELPTYLFFKTYCELNHPYWPNDKKNS